MKQMLITGGTVSGSRFAAGYNTCPRYLRAFPNQTALEEEERK